MTVKELAEKLELTVVAGEDALDNAVKGVYIGDMLSWVMGKLREGEAWITIQGHLNIIAVANLTNAACIIIAEDAEVSADTIKKADIISIPVLKTKESMYSVVKKFVGLEAEGEI